ncbi:hypothetical protein MHI37_08855 [Paenibacillus sp. FSL H8-0548]|nr:hypothetical protein [Paenibacillus sp. FSL H8-0548]
MRIEMIKGAAAAAPFFFCIGNYAFPEAVDNDAAPAAGERITKANGNQGR